ncbi:UNVERIFIED_CONTAM: hypothetical protein HDU68_001131, partial [Siphonaria sp. JEL0065]
ISYSSIFSIDRHFQTPDGCYPIVICGRNFKSVKLTIPSEAEAADIFYNLQKLINTSSVDQLLAFSYEPVDKFTSVVGWTYDVEVEFRRQGLGVKTDAWRITTINKDFSFCSTYPRLLAVPSKISDNVLKHAGKFRSKARIPALSYIHRTNMVTITRCSQPLVGLKQNRSIQDEKLTESIFTTGRVPPVKGQMHLIIDARPSANVMGQTALGAGIESIDNYRDCRIVLLGIQNIHVMRDSINKLMEASLSGDTGASLRAGMDRSGWLNHIRTVLDGTLLIVKSVHSYNTHALVHCSDGWDRTAQLCSLAELCLDPYYRTMEGFQTLVEKEWMSFGHKFRDRLGLLSKPNRDTGSGPSVGSQIQAASKTMQHSFTSAAKNLLKQSTNGSSVRGSPNAQHHGSRLSGSSSHLAASGPQGSVELVNPTFLAYHEVSPIFTQFLDCVYQLWTQFPTHFEFSEKYLLTLNSHLYSSQFGTFLFNNEKERTTFLFKSPSGNAVPVSKATYSVWDYFLSNKSEFFNPLYIPLEERRNEVPYPPSTTSPYQIYAEGDVLFPSPESTRYWMGLYVGGQSDSANQFQDPSNESLGEVKPITAAFVSSLCGANRPGIQLTVGDLDDETDSNGGGGGGGGGGMRENGSGGGSGGSSWQSTFSSTAAQVSSLASLASNTWSIGSGRGVGSSPQPSQQQAAVIATDPLLKCQGYTKSSSSLNDRNGVVGVVGEPSRKVNLQSSAAPSSPAGTARLTLQERLAKTVEGQMSDLDLKGKGGSARVPQQAITTAVVVAEVDEGHKVQKVGTLENNLPHPLWSSGDE